MRQCSAVLIVIALCAFAGTGATAGELSYGAKIGCIISNITETPAEWEDSKSAKAGLTGGVFMNYALSERFSIQPEILYTMKGVKGNLYDGIIPVDVTASFDYFEVPVLAIYTYPLTKTFKPRVYAGPNFGYNFSSELEFSTWLFSGDIDFSSFTQTTEFGIVAGAGFDCALGKGVLTFDARYQRGFTNAMLSGDFYINGSAHTIDEDDFKNYGFAFLVGYGL